MSPGGSRSEQRGRHPAATPRGKPNDDDRATDYNQGHENGAMNNNNGNGKVTEAAAEDDKVIQNKTKWTPSTPPSH